MDLLDLPEVPPKRRAALLEAWCREQPLQAAADAVVQTLAPLLDEEERVAFLNAEGIWFPLATLAHAASGRTASTLWAWASTASLVRGDWADMPAIYAVRAVRADPTDEAAWDAFSQAISTDVLPDIDDILADWARDPALGPAVAARARSLLSAPR